MIYLLIIITVFNTPLTINVDVVSFDNKSNCERNINNIKDQLKGFDTVHVYCTEKVISKAI